MSNNIPNVSNENSNEFNNSKIEELQKIHNSYKNVIIKLRNIDSEYFDDVINEVINEMTSTKLYFIKEKNWKLVKDQDIRNLDHMLKDLHEIKNLSSVEKTEKISTEVKDERLLKIIKNIEESINKIQEYNSEFIAKNHIAKDNYGIQKNSENILLENKEIDIANIINIQNRNTLKSNEISKTASTIKLKKGWFWIILSISVIVMLASILVPIFI
ncbi:hypothetical protein [Mesoplasma photuris]|uniref:hypothetical protein n=1 Tax=Mesoplasma photuris TaxID=217731 RepID=UPI0004E217DB|nr:hypothetical protein [Mesoplasma photuris]